MANDMNTLKVIADNGTHSFPVVDQTARDAASAAQDAAKAAQDAVAEIEKVDLTGYATENYVKNKIAEAELSGGDVDLSGYAEKTDIPTKTSQLTNDSGFITDYTETDPTVPSWAKQEKKPSYTAAEVGALPDTTIIPKKVSQLENDKGYLTAVPAEYVTETEMEEKGYLTQHQSLDAYAKKTDIPATLPNPNKLTFTGGATGEYDGTKAVTITIPEAAAGGSSPVRYVESLDEANLANLRDLETGTYVLYGYFRPYPDAPDTLTCDNTLVSVAHLSAGSHVLVFNPLNCKVNFVEILVDESAASGFSYSVQIIDMRDLPALNNDGADPATVTLLTQPVLDFYNADAYPDDDYTVTHLSKITYPCNADIPVPYTVKWKHNENAMRTTVAVDTKEIGTVNRFGMLTYDATGFDNYPLYNLLPNTTYYYKVTHILSDGSLVEAKSGSFKTSGEPWRLIYIDGTRNVRDLGGWTGLDGRTVKYGKIFRGAALSDSSYPELQLTGKGRRALGELQVQAELNLGAVDTETSIAANCVYKKIGYNNYATAITDETARTYFKTALEWIVECLNASKPIYMHCQGGCDRTGTLSFQLLGLLGVSESDLAKEYELSSFSTIGFGRRRTTTKDVDTYDYVGMVAALKAYSGNTLTDKFVSFATDCGITSDTITTFRNLMLTESQNAPSLTSITATFAQGDTVVYPSTSLADLKSMLTVTAKYSDGSTVAVEDYTLSGSLAVGTSTITVEYEGLMTTFAVEVTESKTVSYTNQIPISTDESGNPYVGTHGEKGYKTDYRISSSGTEGENTGTDITGFIPAVQGDMLRLQNCQLIGNGGNNRIFFYDANKSKLNYIAPSTGSSAPWEWTFDENSYLTSIVLTPPAGSGIDLSSMRYIRLCTNNIDENSIVTVNEEIV